MKTIAHWTVKMVTESGKEIALDTYELNDDAASLVDALVKEWADKNGYALGWEA